MTAVALDLHTFIEDLRSVIPEWVHGAAMATLEDWFYRAHVAADAGDNAELKKWLRLINQKIAQECLWRFEDLRRARAPDEWFFPGDVPRINERATMLQDCVERADSTEALEHIKWFDYMIKREIDCEC
jgi:hypothetical protein